MKKTVKPADNAGDNYIAIIMEAIRNDRTSIEALLTRNGVIVKAGSPNKEVGMIVFKSMKLSGSFKKELDRYLASYVERNENDYANAVGSNFFSTRPKIDSDLFGITGIGSSIPKTSVAKSTDSSKDGFWSAKNIFSTVEKLGSFALKMKEAQAAEAIAKADVAKSGNAVDIVKAQAEAPKNNTGIYVALVLGVLVIAGVLFFALKKKE